MVTQCGGKGIRGIFQLNKIISPNATKLYLICAIALVFSILNTVAFAKSNKVSPSELNFITKYFPYSEVINCKPKGWFSGYSSDTTFAFAHPYLMIIDYEPDFSKKKVTINEVFHIVKIASQTKGQLLGQFYYPSFKAINDEVGSNVNPIRGSFLMSSDGWFGNIQITITEFGDTSSNKFSCEFEIDEKLK
ncbi:hypothetical protein N9D07_02390 [Alphaproteobacteria bacterium]|nr:hypothetical protein [Alphaproteobacteria bacterium]